MVTVDAVASLDENSTFSSSIVFPNPNNGQFSLKVGNNTVDETALTSVIGVDGVIYAEVNPTGNITEFNLNLSAGIYFLRINSIEGEYTHKVIVGK